LNLTDYFVNVFASKQGQDPPFFPAVFNARYCEVWLRSFVAKDNVHPPISFLEFIHCAHDLHPPFVNNTDVISNLFNLGELVGREENCESFTGYMAKKGLKDLLSKYALRNNLREKKSTGQIPSRRVNQTG